MEKLKNLIVEVPNFPKPGVNFKDISQILATEAFDLAISEMARRIERQIDLVVGIESRGFILGAALAKHMGKGFVPVRKRGKLPPPVISMSYTLEYGEDTLEIKKGAGNVVIVDDVLATGGTLKAAADLCHKAGYTVKDMTVLIDLKFLNNFIWQGLKVKSLVDYV